MRLIINGITQASFLLPSNKVNIRAGKNDVSFQVRTVCSRFSSSLFSDPIKIPSSKRKSKSTGQVDIDLTNLINTKNTVFPNPARDFINFNFENKKEDNYKIRLTDITGRTLIKVFNGNLNEGMNSFSIDLQGLNPGLYFIKSSSTSQQTIERFIKI